MADISRVPQTINIELYAGDGFAVRFTSVKKSDGTPFPLDGLVTSQIRAKRTDLEPLTEFAVDATDQDTGIVVVSLTGQQTADLIPVGKTSFKGAWDLQFTPTGAEPITLAQGQVVCDADVTR